MNNYYEKYLKYKNKYFKLKEQINNKNVNTLVGGNRIIDFYTRKIQELKNKTDRIFTQIQKPENKDKIKQEILFIEYYKLNILQKAYDIKISTIRYNEKLKEYEEYKNYLEKINFYDFGYPTTISNMTMELYKIALLIFENNQNIYNNNLSILRLYESLDNLLNYKYIKIITEEKLSYGQRDEFENNFDKNKNFLHEQIDFARGRFEECKIFMGGENSNLFENIVKDNKYLTEHISKLKLELDKYKTGIFEKYIEKSKLLTNTPKIFELSKKEIEKNPSDIEKIKNDTKAKLKENTEKLNSINEQIDLLISLFFRYDSFKSPGKINSVDENLKIFNLMPLISEKKSISTTASTTASEPVIVPKKSKSSSKAPKISGSSGSSGSSSLVLIPNKDIEQEQNYTENINENLDFLIWESIGIDDPKISVPTQTITKEEEVEFQKVEYPRRVQLFDIINFDKVHANMDLLKDEIKKKLTGTNIIVKIKFKELTGDMIIITFYDGSLNNKKIAHFTFHKGFGIAGDPVGPYHFKIDDGTRRYSNLIYERVNNTFYIFNREQFKDNEKILLIIKTLEEVFKKLN
jgi:hypothetical protein